MHPDTFYVHGFLFSIDDTLQVKITDNALSRDLFPMDYHCLGDNENRPVRWMALESLVNNEFSSASDVVSTRAQVSTACRGKLSVLLQSFSILFF